MHAGRRSSLILSCLIVAFALTGLGGCHRRDAAAEACTAATQQYDRDLAAFQQSEQARTGRCDALDREQADLNATLDQTRHAYPFTVDAVVNCTKQPTTDEKQKCLVNYCIAAKILGNVDCGDAALKLKNIGEHQNIIDQSSRRDCCRLATSSDLNSEVGFSPDLSCKAPQAPITPACAAKPAGATQ